MLYNLSALRSMVNLCNFHFHFYFVYKNEVFLIRSEKILLVFVFTRLIERNVQIIMKVKKYEFG